MEQIIDCPLCRRPKADFFHQDRNRTFLNCSECNLVFVTPDQYPTPDEEKKRYLLHNNTHENRGYLDFLYTFIEPLKTRITKNSRGLDYGSGPNPVMAEVLKREGYQISIFDPFFANDVTALQSQYDYLTCVETVEHFHNPLKEWQRMKDLLAGEGLIGIKTSMIEADTRFSSWHYMRDPTHVCFYSRQTFNWIGKRLGLNLEFVDRSIVFFRGTTQEGRLTSSV